MNRISREQMWMEIATVAAKRSTCFRGNVGAVVVEGNRLLSIGYNGPPPGEEHCKGNECEVSETGGCLRSVHAEKNALRRAREISNSLLTGWDLYCTMQPCLDCSQLAAFEYPVSRVFYMNPYRIKEGVSLLLSSNVEVYRVTPSGFIIDEKDNRIVNNEA